MSMNIIKTLNSIDVQSLKKIDFAQIKDILQGKPNIFINIGLITLTLFSAYYLFTSKKNESKKLNQEISLMKDKLAIVEQYNQLKKQYDDFMKNFPESVSSDELINKLSNMAVDHNIQILSISPAQKKTDDWGELTLVNLNISSDSYDDLVRFIEVIENAPFMIRIEKWSGEMKEDYSSRQSTDTDTQETPILADIEIGSYKLKNG